MRELDDHPDIKAALLTGYPRGMAETMPRYRSRMRWRVREPEYINEYIPEKEDDEDE